MSEQARTLDLHDGGETAALAVVGGGVATFVFGMILRSRLLRVLGFLTALAGGGLYVRAKYAERSEKIDSAASHIQSELDDLDPVAQAQVLARLARHEPSDS